MSELRDLGASVAAALETLPEGQRPSDMFRLLAEAMSSAEKATQRIAALETALGLEPEADPAPKDPAVDAPAEEPAEPAPDDVVEEAPATETPAEPEETPADPVEEPPAPEATEPTDEPAPVDPTDETTP